MGTVVDYLPDFVRPKTQVTRDDVIRDGACISGVDEWIAKRKTLLTVISDPIHERIEKAMRLIGYGDGYGYGSGYGYGHGYGYGYGYG
jgi:hypothetical protein